MTKSSVLRRRATDEAENKTISIGRENKGKVGDKPGAKSVLRIAEFGP